MKAGGTLSHRSASVLMAEDYQKKSERTIWNDYEKLDHFILLLGG